MTSLVTRARSCRRIRWAAAVATAMALALPALAAAAPSGVSVQPDTGTWGTAGGPGGRIYALHPDRPTKPRWQAAVDGDAVGVAASSSHVFLLGHYDYIVPKGSTCYQYCPNGTGRRHLAAFDAATGALDAWNPRANTSTGPWGATVTDTHLIVVGEFTTINGQRHSGYAQFARER